MVETSAICQYIFKELSPLHQSFTFNF